MITEEYDSRSDGNKSSASIQDNVIGTTWRDGPYLLVVKIVSSKPNANWNLTRETIFFKHKSSAAKVFGDWNT